MHWETTKGILKIVWPAVGVLAGLSAGACFLYLRAWETAGFALASGVYALLLMAFTIKDYRTLKAIRRCEEQPYDEAAFLYDEGEEEKVASTTGGMPTERDRRGRVPSDSQRRSRRGHLVAEKPESVGWWVFRWLCFVAAAAGASVGIGGIITYALLAQGNHESLNSTSHWLTIGTSYSSSLPLGAEFSSGHLPIDLPFSLRNFAGCSWQCGRS
jgi:hypothetical protein